MVTGEKFGKTDSLGTPRPLNGPEGYMKVAGIFLAEFGCMGIWSTSLQEEQQRIYKLEGGIPLVVPKILCSTLLLDHMHLVLLNSYICGVLLWQGFGIYACIIYIYIYISDVM